jgi:caffeoyl-CoA O-methyltransferase
MPDHAGSLHVNGAEMNKEKPEHTSSPGDPSRGIFCFMDMVAKEAEHYAAEHTTPLSPLLEEIARFTMGRMPFPSMLSGRVEAQFLQLMVRLSGAQKIVDIGTFTGYSALAMAEVMPDDGEIITIEHNPVHADIARDFFNRSPHGSKIRLCIGDALEIMKLLPDKKTNLVFIDADKKSYAAYYEEAMRILRKGGFILADNALWYGQVLDPKDDDSRAMAEFNEIVKADPRAEKLFLTIRDGIYLIRKL